MQNSILLVETIALSLGGQIQKKGGYLCICPAHIDETPRLSLTHENGKVLFHCHAGCSQSAVVEELRKLDLWNSKLLHSDSGPSSDSQNEQNWPAPLRKAAYHGITGELVRAIMPNSEADPAAVLVQFLVCFGNLIGRSAYFQIGASRQFTNLYAVLVGNSSTGRKGTSFEAIADILKEVDAGWWQECRVFGLGSGEALVASVKDASFSSNENRSLRFNKDKRALVTEGEYASILKVSSREGNTLSPNLRNAFDSGELRSITKNETLKATDAHVSMIAHITKPELDRSFKGSTDIANGTANRNLWIATKRSKLVPFPEPMNIDLKASFISRLRSLAEFARSADEVKMSEEAKTEYAVLYNSLTRDKLGILGTLTARSAPIVLRLSTLYAVLDKSSQILPDHLSAAEAVWNYSEASVRYIFGDSTGDKAADQILEALRENPNGLTRSDFHRMFNRNITSDKLNKALNLLRSANLISSTKSKGSNGRELTLWSLSNYEFNEVD